MTDWDDLIFKPYLPTDDEKISDKKAEGKELVIPEGVFINKELKDNPRIEVPIKEVF